jgi:Histidine kinase
MNTLRRFILLILGRRKTREALLRQVGESAAQEERNRLARDLHDSIKQQLFSINVGAATAQERWESDPEGARTALADIRRSAREAMVEMQALLHQLRPRALGSTVGLFEAMREQGEALEYRSGAQVTVELGSEIPDDRMPPGAYEALFRIAQEALANVGRHARARTVRVRFGREGDSAFLRVEDDGQGFQAGEEGPGMGLRNIRERAESLQATLQVTSTPAVGTTVAVGIPLTSPLSKPSRLEKAIHEDWGTAFTLTPIIVLLGSIRLFPRASWLIFWKISSLCLIASSAINYYQRSTRRALTSSSQDENAASVATLQYLSHRNLTLCSLLAPGWTLSIWGQWAAAWLVAALLCAGLTMTELVRLHHVSEVRHRWWRVSRLHPTPSIWSCAILLCYLGFLIFLQRTSNDPSLEGRPLEPAEILFLLFVAAVLLYIRTRQPRSAGVPQ